MPQVVLLFSGKRKSGKDFITTHLQKLLGDRCEVIKISQPIKSHWAKEKNLDLTELLSDGDYKEQYRLDMINWSEEMRAKDYGYFCKIATDNASERPVWIVSDIRRKTDIRWFNETYGDLIRNIRIYADEDTRKNRGFVFKTGVDDVTSECDLDDYTGWDLVLDNSNGKQDIEDQLRSIIRLNNYKMKRIDKIINVTINREESTINMNQSATPVLKFHKFSQNQKVNTYNIKIPRTALSFDK